MSERGIERFNLFVYKKDEYTAIGVERFSEGNVEALGSYYVDHALSWRKAAREGFEKITSFKKDESATTYVRTNVNIFRHNHEVRKIERQLDFSELKVSVKPRHKLNRASMLAEDAARRKSDIGEVF